MTRAKPYPKTDAAEQDAVNILLGLIDARFVKADIRTRDKYPNVDGTLELVGEDQVPLGKFEVQIRKVAACQNRYSCPETLVAYSRVSTLPVVLICVDTSTRRAHWKQISPLMPERKEGQRSFTIHFDEAADSIDKRVTYFQKWLQIVRDYQERIAKYPCLKREVINRLTLTDIPRQDRVVFQRFIDTVNKLLDTDFIAVKEILFADVWKLGLGVFPSSEESVSYQLYKIPYGEPVPLICMLEGSYLTFDQSTPYAVSNHWRTRDDFSDPELAGRRYILDQLRQVLNLKALPIHGTLLSTDVLIAFIDEYSQCLGLPPYQDTYSLDDISHALNDYLPGICNAIALELPKDKRNLITFDMDWLARYLSHNTVTPASHAHPLIAFALESSRVSIKAAFEALRYLSAAGVSTIKRFWIRQSRPLSPGDNWIWSGYTPEAEIHNVRVVLKRSLEEYKTFIKGNHLRLDNSTYLDSHTSTIYEYEPSFARQPWQCPIINEHHVENAQSGLPKLSVRITTGKRGRIDLQRFPTVQVDGYNYKAVASSRYLADFLFQRTPVLNMLYELLRRDLEAHYNIG